jgi:hypothetical protein
MILESPRFDAEASNIALATVYSIRLGMGHLFDALMKLDFDINKTVCYCFDDVDERKMVRSSPLLAAIGTRHIPLFGRICGHPRFRLSPQSGRWALFASVSCGERQLFQVLLDMVNDISCRNSYNESLLVFACLFRSVAIVQQLIAHPHFNLLASDATKALGAAIRSGSPQLIPILVELPGVDIRRPFPPDINGNRGTQAGTGDGWGEGVVHVPMLPTGVPPLVAAAVVARADVFLAILKVHDVDVNARNEKGEPLLFICLPDLAKLQGLLGHPALRINECDRHGNSALMVAVKKKSAAAVQALADRGIDLHLKSKGGETAWDLAGDGTAGPPADRFEFVQKLISIIQKSKMWSSHS